MRDTTTLTKRLGLFTRIWWFGPLSGGAIAIGFSNCVGISLSLLFYFSSLTQFSLNLLVVVFCSCLLLMTNLMLLYGSVKSKPHLLLPWMITNSLATLALLVYTAIKWTELVEFKAVSVGVVIFSVYFCAVVSSFYHELVATRERVVKEREKEVDSGVGTARLGGQLPDREETVLVNLDQECTPPPALPSPEEVIRIKPVVTLASTNPFFSDVFKVKQNKPSSDSPSAQFDIQSDFTPFKKLQAEDSVDTSAKLKVFLPGAGDESDFDFSFNDPDFDSSLCAVRHSDI